MVSRNMLLENTPNGRDAMMFVLRYLCAVRVGSGVILA